jgi:hypothetical protein
MNRGLLILAGIVFFVLGYERGYESGRNKAFEDMAMYLSNHAKIEVTTRPTR